MSVFVGGPLDGGRTDSVEAQVEVRDGNPVGVYRRFRSLYLWGRWCVGCGAAVSVARADPCPLCGARNGESDGG